MLRLAILRHAKAYAHAPGGDIERPLTKHGRTDAARMGAYLRDNGLRFDLALVSPARRTRETFEVVAQSLPHDLQMRTDMTLYNADGDTVRALLAQTPPRLANVLVVGHNPGLAELAMTVAPDGPRASLAAMRSHFPAPCLAVVAFQCNDWADMRHGTGLLEHFVTPDQLSG